MAKRKKDKDSDKEGKKLPKPALNLASETKRGIAVIVFIALALIVVLSIANVAGSLGADLFHLLSLAFGLMAYAVPLILLSVAISLYKRIFGQRWTRRNILLESLFWRCATDWQYCRGWCTFFIWGIP